MAKCDITMKFHVTPEEKEIIEKRCKSLGITNRSAYLRKMAIDGYMLRLNMPEIKEVIRLLRSVSNSANQMAKRANEGGHVDGRELGRLREVIHQMWDLLNALLEKLGSLLSSPKHKNEGSDRNTGMRSLSFLRATA